MNLHGLPRLAWPLVIAFALAAPTSAQHSTHRLAPIALEILERPVPLRTAIGRAHDTAATSSKEAQAFYDQGLAYLQSYTWIEAARSFHTALKHDPKLALAHVGLSVAYVELNRPTEARKAIDAARALAPGLPDHDRRHLEARDLQMRAEEAPADSARLAAYRKSLDDALNAFPQDVELLLQRGLAESADPADRGQGSTATAMPYYEKALALASGHFAAHHYLAHA